jgi:hypothetical protein
VSSFVLFGGVAIIAGLLFVLYGLRGTPPLHAPAQFWRIGITLLGLGQAGIGSCLGLFLPTAIAEMGTAAYHTQPVFVALFVFASVEYLGMLIVVTCVWIGIHSRQRQLTQREPPHDA